MKVPSCLGPPGRDRSLGLLLSLASLSTAISFNPVPPSNVDFSNLGRVGLAGDFDGVSLYQFQGQSENGVNTNGSQSVLAQFPNGGFATLATSDASIRAMCSFVLKDGTDGGVIVGGNFTSLGGIDTSGAAMFNPNSSTVTALAGLSGQVSALLCDQDTNTVYFGGNLMGKNSTNAIAWVGKSGWANLPFGGFNGPVTSITKASNGNIIFGGEFTALGNATGPSEPDQQVINIAGANITSGGSATTAGFSDPKNIVCKTNETSGAGNTWLLADATPGFLDARFGYVFSPTKLRLFNTHQDGRGTQTWRYTSHDPVNGIMNFTYIDPATGQNASCSSECPLSSNASQAFQDFHFVNVVGMNGFRVDISAWYGSGGGLDGIALFENDISAYAVTDFNEPSCAGIPTASNATSTGPWKVSPSLQSLSGYLSATVKGSEAASVVFLPDIKQSGNYSVNIITPGCVQDNTCSTRGRVTINGTMSSGSGPAFSTEIFQSNNFDKFDQIYFGFVEASSASFRPSITLSPSPGQDIDLTVVAQQVSFALVSSTGGLNNLFEYDPSQTTIDAANFTSSAFDQAGLSFQVGSKVNALVTSGSATFVGGNFSTDTANNIISIDDKATPLSNGGLNGEVTTLFSNGSILYVGGKFTNTSTDGVFGLSNVATYDISRNAWGALGAGVNGPVVNIVPLIINVTANTPETVITLTGHFSQILAFGSNSSSSANGFAVWVPSRGNWLQNLGLDSATIDGELTASVDVQGGSLIAGSLSSSQLGVNGVVSLSNGPSLSPFPINIRPSQTQSLSKRDSTGQNFTGVATGLFYETGGRNITILGGHFTATGSNGSVINNLVFINGSNADATTGVGPSISADSTIMALAVQGDTLYAGGSLTGNVNGNNVNGLVLYNLLTSTFPSQPPALGGGSVSVRSITVRPNTADVYVGGSFSSASALECPGVCLYSTSISQWNRPGTNLAGTANTMLWTSPNSLTVGGDLKFNGASISLATYDAKAQVWSEADGASSIPGPVTALAAGNSDASQLWVAGTASNGSAFLMNYDGNTWTSAVALGTGTTIRGLQMLPLTTDHDSSALVSTSETLMVTGALVVPGFGNASAVLFNGTGYEPFLLTTSDNGAGSVSQLFSQEQNFFREPGMSFLSTAYVFCFPLCSHRSSVYPRILTSTGGHLAVGLVVLISLALALFCTFALVVIGVIVERLRRRSEGYRPAPTVIADQRNTMGRIPPSQLLGALGHDRDEVERQASRI